MLGTGPFHYKGDEDKVVDRGMALIELASGVTPGDVAVKTQANYRVALS
jgi:hypothetical protein